MLAFVNESLKLLPQRTQPLIRTILFGPRSSFQKSLKYILNVVNISLKRSLRNGKVAYHDIKV
jgi:hypothetical protein